MTSAPVWPWCGRCDGPVDAARVVGPRRGDVVAVEARCHGQTKVRDMPVVQQHRAVAPDGGAPW